MSLLLIHQKLGFSAIHCRNPCWQYDDVIRNPIWWWKPSKGAQNNEAHECINHWVFHIHESPEKIFTSSSGENELIIQKIYYRYGKLIICKLDTDFILNSKTFPSISSPQVIGIVDNHEHSDAFMSLRLIQYLHQIYGISNRLPLACHCKCPYRSAVQVVSTLLVTITSIITRLWYIILIINRTNIISGTGKKIDSLSQKKDCDVLQKWKKSVVNHIFWCAASTDDDDEDLKEAKVAFNYKSYHEQAFGTWQSFVSPVPSWSIAWQRKKKEMAQAW